MRSCFIPADTCVLRLIRISVRAYNKQITGGGQKAHLTFFAPCVHALFALGGDGKSICDIGAPIRTTFTLCTEIATRLHLFFLLIK